MRDCQRLEYAETTSERWGSAFRGETKGMGSSLCGFQGCRWLLLKERLNFAPGLSLSPFCLFQPFLSCLRHLETDTFWSFLLGSTFSVLVMLVGWYLVDRGDGCIALMDGMAFILPYLNLYTIPNNLAHVSAPPSSLALRYSPGGSSMRISTISSREATKSPSVNILFELGLAICRFSLIQNLHTPLFVKQTAVSSSRQYPTPSAVSSRYPVRMQCRTYMAQWNEITPKSDSLYGAGSMTTDISRLEEQRLSCLSWMMSKTETRCCCLERSTYSRHSCSRMEQSKLNLSPSAPLRLSITVVVKEEADLMVHSQCQLCNCLLVWRIKDVPILLSPSISSKSTHPSLTTPSAYTITVPPIWPRRSPESPSY